MTTIRRLAGPFALAILVAACSATGGAAPSPTPTPTPTPPGVIRDPNAPVGTVPGGGGSLPGPGGGGDPIIPKPGQLDPRPVRLDMLQASVNGHHVIVRADWTSGVAPCTVLDTILVQKGDHAFAITLREGHGPEDVACIEIAQLKHTFIDLGDLDPGSYTVTDGTGQAAPIQVIVS
jgi:hypothetical protein